MKHCTLILPTEAYLPSFLRFCLELKRSGDHYYGIPDPDAFETWRHTLIQEYEDHRHGRNLPEGFVPGTHFWLVEDDEVIGSVSIRHELNDWLRQFGGHIGYAIRPDKWGQGYGAEQLRLALIEARKLGIERALLTCDEGNPASARVMEKNGGEYVGTFDVEVDGEPRRVRRYWIDTNQD